MFEKVTYHIAVVALLAGASLVSAQEPRMRTLEILVQEIGTYEDIARLAPGDSLDLPVGKRFTLRMTAIPAESHRSARYPSTRFSIPAAGRQITIEGTDEKVGAITLMARQPTNSGATVVQWEILSPLNIPEELRTARIYLRVKPAEDRPQTPPAATPPTPQDQAKPGVTLYEHADFGGRSQRFWVNELHDLTLTDVGNDSASSVRVDPGCRVTLYQHQHFRGTSSTIEGEAPSLRDWPVGNDSVSSFRLECGAVDSRPGVVLYEQDYFRGRNQRFTADSVADLNGSTVGNDAVNSARVDPGCRLTLYQHQNHRGESVVLTGDAQTLSRTPVGNDAASSFHLDCSGGAVTGAPAAGRGVTLYDGEDFRGTEENFDRDDADLRDNKLGDDRLRSLRIDRGCRATLYELPNYRGRSMVVDRDYSSLRNTELDRDTVSSLRVDCR